MLDGFGGKLGALQDYKTVRERAFSLTGANRSDGLCSLDSENPRLRDRYGRDRFGQSLLLARRLVERGVSFVGVHFNNMTKCDGWDTHKDNFNCLRNELLPTLDRGLSALLDDLADRQLLEVTGEGYEPYASVVLGQCLLDRCAEYLGWTSADETGRLWVRTREDEDAPD